MLAISLLRSKKTQLADFMRSVAGTTSPPDLMTSKMYRRQPEPAMNPRVESVRAGLNVIQQERPLTEAAVKFPT